MATTVAGSGGGQPTPSGALADDAAADDLGTDEPPQPPGIPRSRPARILLGVAIAAYVGFFSYWTIRSHEGLGTYGFDFGIYDQGIWLLSRFRGPEITIIGRNLFGDHTSFILLLLVPVYWVLPSAKVLLVAQAGALGAAALPAFLIGREKLRSEILALFIAVAYLAHPAIGWANMEQFHPDVFEVPLLLFAFWYMLKERWVGFAICVGALLLVKEDVPLLTFVLGLYVAVRYDRKVGLLTSAASAVWFAVAVWGILPALNGKGSLNAWRIPFGGPGGLLRTAFTDPTDLISYLTGPDRPFYVWQLLVPLALLSLLAPALLLIAAGPLASNVLSTFWYQYHLQYHYTTLIVPVLVTAAVVGIARFRSPLIRRSLVGIATASAVVSAYLWGSTPFARDPAWVGDPGNVHVDYMHEAIELIPSDAPVSAFYAYVTHLTHRPQVYEFPEPWVAQWWGVFDKEGQRLPAADDIEYVLLPAVMDAQPTAVLDTVTPDFDLVYAAGGVRLYQRR